MEMRRERVEMRVTMMIEGMMEVMIVMGEMEEVVHILVSALECLTGGDPW